MHWEEQSLSTGIERKKKKGYKYRIIKGHFQLDGESPPKNEAKIQEKQTGMFLTGPKFHLVLEASKSPLYLSLLNMVSKSH